MATSSLICSSQIHFISLSVFSNFAMAAYSSSLISIITSLLLLSGFNLICFGRKWDPFIKMLTDDDEGTRWAVLVAGSNGYENYRHQADVCHAYQLLKRGGLKDENIVVFMYDDIAYNPLNPRQGIIINDPQGQDVYEGVPKDYTGESVTTSNLLAVILGDKSAVNGGSGKVVDSKPEDHIFIFYSDHGGPGVLGMPNAPPLYADDLIDVLKKKHASNSYKEMVIYVEACESGSIFEGIMPEDLNIYVTTAANAEESSWAFYCPGDYPPPPPEYDVCLGDIYSGYWMEDSETHNRKERTLEQQYESVKMSISVWSHVMEYGTKSIREHELYLYQGFDPSNANVTDNSLASGSKANGGVIQRDADLLFMWRRYQRLSETSKERKVILKEMIEKMVHRNHLDSSIDFIGKLLFGVEKGPSTISATRPSKLPLVDDWNCLKSMVGVFESHCGSLTQHGMKHMRAFANICNNGVSMNIMEEACISACGRYNSAKWSPLNRGYSA